VLRAYYQTQNQKLLPQGTHKGLFPLDAVLREQAIEAIQDAIR
jgi:hypothetical protein